MQHATKEQKNNYYKLQANMIKHICYIYNRAVRRFSYDNQLWIEYIDFLQIMKSYSLLNGVYGQALALNPKCEALWISAVVYEINVNNNIHAARILYQTALRKNTSNEVLWLKYFEFEIWQASRILERRRLLQLVGSEEDDQGNTNSTTNPSPNAVAGVIFNHAIQSFSKKNHASTDQYDLDIALSMYSSATAISNNQLLNQLEDSLKSSFSHKSELWCYLVCNTMQSIDNSTGSGNSKGSGNTVVDSIDHVNTHTRRCIGYIQEYYNVCKKIDTDTNDTNTNTANTNNTANNTDTMSSNCTQMIALCKQLLIKNLQYISNLNYQSVTLSKEGGSEFKVKSMSKRRRLAFSVHKTGQEMELLETTDPTPTPTPSKKKHKKDKDTTSTSTTTSATTSKLQLSGEYDYLIEGVLECMMNIECIQTIVLKYIELLDSGLIQQTLVEFNTITTATVNNTNATKTTTQTSNNSNSNSKINMLTIMNDIMTIDYTILTIQHIYSDIYTKTSSSILNTLSLSNTTIHSGVISSNNSNVIVTKDSIHVSMLNWLTSCIHKYIQLFALSNKNPILSNNNYNKTDSDAITQLISIICELFDTLMVNYELFNVELVLELCELHTNKLYFINLLCYNNNNKGCELFMKIISMLLTNTSNNNSTNSNNTTSNGNNNSSNNNSIQILKYIQNNIKHNYINTNTTNDPNDTNTNTTNTTGLPRDRQDWCCVLLNYYIACSECMNISSIMNIQQYIKKCQDNSPQNWINQSQSQAGTQSVKIDMNIYFHQLLHILTMSTATSVTTLIEDKVGLMKAQKIVLKDAMMYYSGNGSQSMGQYTYWESKYQTLTR